MLTIVQARGRECRSRLEGIGATKSEATWGKPMDAEVYWEGRAPMPS
jgi:hypothetical protein